MVVGMNRSKMATFDNAISLDLTVPRQLCYTCFPNSPLCHPAMFSSCMYTRSYAFSLCTILFALSCFLFVCFWQALLNFKTVFHLLLDPLTLRDSSLCNLFRRSLSPTDKSIFSPSEVVMLVLTPKSRPISFPLFSLCFLFSHSNHSLNGDDLGVRFCQ